MNLAQTSSGTTGQAAPMPQDVIADSKYTFAQLTSGDDNETRPPGHGYAQTKVALKQKRGNHAQTKAERGNHAQTKAERGNFAQVFAQQDKTLAHTCQSTHLRNKGTNYDFNAISTGSVEFEDEQFPTGDALYWYDAGENGQSVSQISGI